MEVKTISKSEYVNKFKAVGVLKLTKISLLIFSLGIFVVGRRESTWPIVNWALYSGYTARFRTPEPVVSAVEFRVYTTTGELYVVKPEHILTVPYDSLSHYIVEQALSDGNVELRDESRRYLIGAIARFIDADSAIKTIQAWKTSYQVEPLTVPPIQKQAPIAEVMLGSFSEKDLI